MINQPDNTQCDVNSTGYCEKHGREYYKCQSNTQELDEILDAFASGEVSPHWKDKRKTYTKLEANQAILDWHNKQIEAVLDRLEKEINTGRTFTNDYVISEAIEAERNKLKGLVSKEE